MTRFSRRRRPTMADFNERRSTFERFERDVEERELARYEREQDEAAAREAWFERAQARWLTNVEDFRP